MEQHKVLDNIKETGAEGLGKIQWSYAFTGKITWKGRIKHFPNLKWEITEISENKYQLITNFGCFLKLFFRDLTETQSFAEKQLETYKELVT